MWKISKTFNLAYGHRVWTQQLNGDFANDLKCACRHLHGHEGKIQVFLSGDELDHTGMITDFRHLEFFKKWIDKFVDHKFIIDKNDPLFQRLVGDVSLSPITIPGCSTIAGFLVAPDDLGVEGTPEFEMMEGFLIVDFVPTSENLSKWIFVLISEKMRQIDVNCTQVDWWETEKSVSSYFC